jgi:hypothetical protein
VSVACMLMPTALLVLLVGTVVATGGARASLTQLASSDDACPHNACGGAPAAIVSALGTRTSRACFKNPSVSSTSEY